VYGAPRGSMLVGAFTSVFVLQISRRSQVWLGGLTT